MRMDYIGAIVGLVFGFGFGAGGFGLIGGLVGGIIGALIGGGTARLFGQANADVLAAPHPEHCPIVEDDATVTYDSHDPDWAMAGGKAPTVTTCSHWPEHADCGQPCVQKKVAA